MMNKYILSSFSLKINLIFKGKFNKYKMYSLIKFLKFKILNLIDDQDLSNFQLTSKYWYNLISSSEFWDYKTLTLYGQIVHQRPIQYTSRQWYHRVNQSGSVYVVDQTENKMLAGPYIHQFKICDNRYYFIDIWDHLWYGQYNFEATHFNINICSFNFYDDQLICLYSTHLGRYLQHIGYDLPNQLIHFNALTNIKSIHPTNITDFILTHDSKLYCLRDTSLVICTDNVKYLSGTRGLCFYITNNNDLFYFKMTNSTISSVFIAPNVISAQGGFIGHNNAILFQSNDNKLFQSNDNKLFQSNDNKLFQSNDNKLFIIQKNETHPIDYSFKFPSILSLVQNQLIIDSDQTIIDTDVLSFIHERNICYLKKRPISILPQ